MLGSGRLAVCCDDGHMKRIMTWSMFGSGWPLMGCDCAGQSFGVGW